MSLFVPLFAGLPGGLEVLVVLLVVVLLFGANRLPKLARASGQALGEFQRGRAAAERRIDEALPAEEPAVEQSTPAARPQSALSLQLASNPVANRMTRTWPPAERLSWFVVSDVTWHEPTSA
jgi:sec-independent protein translocase protein TatA